MTKRAALLSLSLSLSLLLCWGGLPRGRTVAVAESGRAAPDGPAVYWQWLRVEARHPRTLLAGGTFRCLRFLTGRQCPLWIMRSTDGGIQWTDLRMRISKIIGLLGDSYFTAPIVHYILSPVVLAGDSTHVYMDAFTAASATSAFGYLLWSADGGAQWQATGPSISASGSACAGGGGIGAGYHSAAPSPLSVNRVYAILDGGGGMTCGVVYSDDAGRSFANGSDPSRLVHCRSLCRPWGALVADPVRVNTVYANVIVLVPTKNGDSVQRPAFAARSDDAGLHWSMVMTPTVPGPGPGPLQTFSVAIDPHEGTQLVGRTHDRGIPADRRYLSGDAGRSWRVATCAGDLQGACPAFTLDNVFGAGASYGFVHDGVYRFHGGGPAEARLRRVSARLPARTADLLDVGGGTQAGAPLYLLARGDHGTQHGALYRSTDGGRSWRLLLARRFPLTLPP